jgi:hypothetical protein
MGPFSGIAPTPACPWTHDADMGQVYGQDVPEPWRELSNAMDEEQEESAGHL